MNDDVLEIQDDDVVIVIRPQYNNKGVWDGTIDIVQSASNDQTPDTGVRAAALTAMLMVMLPSFFKYDSSVKTKLFDFIHQYHPDAVEAFMSHYVFDKE